MTWKLIVIAVFFVLMILDIHVFRHLKGAPVVVEFGLWMLITLVLLHDAVRKTIKKRKHTD